MLRIALIFPYFRTRAVTEMLFPPLGLAALAGQLRGSGMEVRIFDGTFSTPEKVIEELAAFRPDVAGIYSMIGLSRNAFRLADALRACVPGCLLVAGGPMPTLFPARYLPRFDAAFRGEADVSFPRFCRDVDRMRVGRDRLADLPLPSYAGLFIGRPDLNVDNAPVHYREEEIASFPLPDRSGFDHAAYQEAWLEKDESRTTSILTTLGCPFGCDFCSKPVFGNVFRRRNLDAVFEEIAGIRAMGYDRLWIADDSLTLSRRHLEEFCGRMAGLDLAWSCLTRADSVDHAMARHMRESGCHRVYLGLESGSQDTLGLMNKRFSVEESARTVRGYREAGIEVAAFFLVGYPGESLASIEETFRFALSLPLDEISFNVPFPLPGSRLFDRVSGVDETLDWNAENEITFVYRSEFDQSWLRRRIAETLEAFAHRDRGKQPAS
jgi:anaerobic magnesium-protoporphyrin IX monomethyl ester cyclase